MVLFYILGALLGFAVFFIVGETLCNYLPNTKFSKWWRQFVISECEECD